MVWQLWPTILKFRGNHHIIIYSTHPYHAWMTWKVLIRFYFVSYVSPNSSNMGVKKRGVCYHRPPSTQYVVVFVLFVMSFTPRAPLLVCTAIQHQENQHQHNWSIQETGDIVFRDTSLLPCQLHVTCSPMTWNNPSLTGYTKLLQS